MKCWEPNTRLTGLQHTRQALYQLSLLPAPVSVEANSPCFLSATAVHRVLCGAVCVSSWSRSLGFRSQTLRLSVLSKHRSSRTSRCCRTREASKWLLGAEASQRMPCESCTLAACAAHCNGGCICFLTTQTCIITTLANGTGVFLAGSYI